MYQDCSWRCKVFSFLRMQNGVLDVCEPQHMLETQAPHTVFSLSVRRMFTTKHYTGHYDRKSITQINNIRKDG